MPIKIDSRQLISGIIAILILVVVLIYGKHRNKREADEIDADARFAIGTTIKRYKNFRSPNSTVKYMFTANGWPIKEFEEIPNSLHGLIITTGGRYYVKFSAKNPGNCKLLLTYPVPDSVKFAPETGFLFIPGHKNSN